jgi:hypothetical protein
MTIRRLMVLVLATALNVAFVRLAAADWGGREVLVLVGCLCALTVPLAIVRPGRGRAMAAGFACGGGLYLLLTLGLAARLDMTGLPTTDWLDRLYIPICGADQVGCLIEPRMPRNEYFRIGQCLAGLIAAGAGGLAGLVLDAAARGARARSRPIGPPAGQEAPP